MEPPIHIEASSEDVAYNSSGRAKTSTHQSASIVAEHGLASAIKLAEKKNAENTFDPSVRIRFQI